MVLYFTDGDCTLTSEMIRILTEDKQFAYNNRLLTMRLLDMVEKQKLNEVLKDDNGTLISDIPWDDTIEKNSRINVWSIGIRVNFYHYLKQISL